MIKWDLRKDLMHNPLICYLFLSCWSCLTNRPKVCAPRHLVARASLMWVKVWCGLWFQARCCFFFLNHWWANLADLKMAVCLLSIIFPFFFFCSTCCGLYSPLSFHCYLSCKMKLSVGNVLDMCYIVLCLNMWENLLNLFWSFKNLQWSLWYRKCIKLALHQYGTNIWLTPENRSEFFFAWFPWRFTIL